MIAEGDDAFGSKVVFEGIDQEICFEQNAMVQAGNILISMMMGNEPADSFYLCGCESNLLCVLIIFLYDWTFFNYYTYES